MTELSAYRKALAERREQRIREEEGNATPAKLCKCDPPLTYEEEDGEKRCLCGRAVR